MRTNINYTTRRVNTTDASKSTIPRKGFEPQMNVKDLRGGGGTVSGGYVMKNETPRKLK